MLAHGGWGGRERGSSGGIIMDLALAINFNQFKTHFLGIKLHYPCNTPGPERGSRCLCLSSPRTCLV